MPVLIRYEPESLSREAYDKVNETLAGQGNEGPPGPLRIHVLFGEEPNLRVSEIWDSEDAWRRWYEGSLQGALSDAGVDLPEPEVIQVHELWGSGLQPT